MASVEDEAVTALITSVYNDVWDEFYAWEQDYCASEIRSLQRDAPPNADASEESRESEPAELVTPQSFFTNAFIDSDLLHWEYPAEVVERRDDTENLIDYQIVHLKAPKLSPTPHYESCNPMSTSILAGDDPDEMPFIPFPGSADFEFDAYRNQHEKFSWENERMDPDKETIILESIRRLDNYHDVPLEKIKQVLLPDLPISKLGQRDLLQWSSFEIRHDEIPASPSPPEHWDTKARFEGVAKHFCPNLNCIEAFCALHEWVPPIGPPNYASAQEKTARDPGPCGPQCYLSGSDSSNGSYEIGIDEAIQNTVSTILSVCPDLTDCQLAIACNRTCRDTHAIRKKLETSATEESSSKEADDPGWDDLTNTVINKLNDFTLGYDPGPPCAHPGSCDNAAACPCYQNKAHCEKGCRCSPQCIRRFRGCKCRVWSKQRQGMKTCASKSCPCIASGRECDPEVCLPCKMEGGRCMSSQIQRGDYKRTIVKQSRFGYGLFLDQPVHAGELIVEYTGEIIYESTVDSRAFFNEFRGRNYVYKLNNMLSIDATKVGNESRFINHDRERVNCTAKYMLVNGVQRIGIYAAKHMKAGTELYLDYGNEFFKKK